MLLPLGSNLTIILTAQKTVQGRTLFSDVRAITKTWFLDTETPTGFYLPYDITYQDQSWAEGEGERGGGGGAEVGRVDFGCASVSERISSYLSYT